LEPRQASAATVRPTSGSAGLARAAIQGDGILFIASVKVGACHDLDELHVGHSHQPTSSAISVEATLR
jgi:hypothetical protein